MKKLSVILVALLVLTVISGCSKRTAGDLETDTDTESETIGISVSTESSDVKETDELKKIEREGQKTPKQSESNETKKEDDTTKPIETESETKGTTVNPEPSGNISPSPSGGNSNPSPGNTPEGNNTTKTPDTTKQPASTTATKTPAPAETTKQSDPPKPAEEPKPQSDSKLPATVEIFPYKGGNIAVVNVKNEKGKNCSVQVQGTYKKADGSTIRTETKQFSGLSEGDDNYFIFNPGIAFADFTCVTKEISDGAPAYSGLITFETKGEMHNAADHFLSLFGGNYDPSFEQYNYLASQINYTYSGSELLYCKADILVFDNTGKPVTVGNYKGSLEAKGCITCNTDIKCDRDGNNHVIPDNLKGNMSFIISITYLSEKPFM